MEKQTYSNIVEYPLAGWAEQQTMRRCQIGAPAARVGSELAGIRATSRSTDEIIERALARLALVGPGMCR